MSAQQKKAKYRLIGGFNPVERYARQIGAFPKWGLKSKNRHRLVEEQMIANPTSSGCWAQKNSAIHWFWKELGLEMTRK